MKVTFGEKLKMECQGNGLLGLATRYLEEIMEGSAEQAVANWDQERDERGRILYRLSLSDADGKVSTAFTPDDLASDWRTRSRLLGLWGDLLQIRSAKQLKKIQELVAVGD